MENSGRFKWGSEACDLKFLWKLMSPQNTKNNLMKCKTLRSIWDSTETCEETKPTLVSFAFKVGFERKNVVVIFFGKVLSPYSRKDQISVAPQWSNSKLSDNQSQINIVIVWHFEKYLYFLYCWEFFSWLCWCPPLLIPSKNLWSLYDKSPSLCLSVWGRKS